jgi:hypothetical protein
MSIENPLVPVPPAKQETSGKDSPEMLRKVIELQKKEMKYRNELLEAIKVKNEKLKNGIEQKILEFNELIHGLVKEHESEISNRDKIIAEQEAELTYEKWTRLRQSADAFEERVRTLAERDELEEKFDSSERRLESLTMRLVQNGIEPNTETNTDVAQGILAEKKKLLGQFKLVLGEKRKLVEQLGLALVEKNREIEGLKDTLVAQKKGMLQSTEHELAIEALQARTKQLREALRNQPLDIEITDDKDVIARVPLSTVSSNQARNGTQKSFFGKVKSFFGF